MAVKSGNGYRRKQRNSGARVRRSVVLLATEGRNQTETLYFKDLAKDRGCIVRFVPGNYTDPANMARTMKNFYEELELSPELGDHAYCLIDADCGTNNKNAQIAKADRIAEEGGFEVLMSAPCFEVWFLCHFGCSTKQYNSNRDVIADLEQKIPGYSKSMAGIYDKLKTQMGEALENAKVLEKFCVETGYSFHTADFSPSTEAYKAVESFLK